MVDTGDKNRGRSADAQCIRSLGVCGSRGALAFSAWGPDVDTHQVERVLNCWGCTVCLNSFGTTPAGGKQGG